MTKTLLALAIAVGGAVFCIVSGTSYAAPTAPLSVGSSRGNGSATLVSWHAGRGVDHRKMSGSTRGGIFARLGHFRSLLGMLAGGQGGMGGMSSMFGMGGSGDMGGMASMLRGMGGSGGSGGMGEIASMFGGMAGSGGTQSTTAGRVSQSARQACTPDAMRLCSDYIPDVGKITACMRAKSAQLSEPCRAAMNSEGANASRFAGRGVTAPVRGRGQGSYDDSESAANFSGGQSFGSFETGDSYDRTGVAQGLSGAGGIDIGRMLGMARSFGFGQSGGW